MWKFLGYGLKEMYRGLWIRAQVKQLQRFMPDLRISDVTRCMIAVITRAYLQLNMTTKSYCVF